MGFIKVKSCKIFHPRTCIGIIHKSDLIRRLKLIEVDSRMEVFLSKQHGDHYSRAKERKKTSQVSSAFLFNGQMAAVIHFLRFKHIRVTFIESFLPWLNHINNIDLNSSSQCCKTVKSLGTWNFPQNSCSRSVLHWSSVYPLPDCEPSTSCVT